MKVLTPFCFPKGVAVFRKTPRNGLLDLLAGLIFPTVVEFRSDVIGSIHIVFDSFSPVSMVRAVSSFRKNDGV